MRHCFYHTDLGQNAVFHNFAIQIARIQYSGRSIDQNFNCAVQKHNLFHMNLKKKETCACDHLKTTNLSADNFKKYLRSMGRHLSPRYGQVILVSGYPVLTAVN